MFDLITGNVRRAPRHQAASLLVSIAVQASVAAAVVMATVLVVDSPVPRAVMMMAFVAAPPPPPPPPPPPKAPEPAQTASKPMPTNPAAAPVDLPREITPEGPPVDLDDESFEGVPGGVVGGVAGGLEPLAPPPPPPPEPRKPIRVGGVIKEPALVYRVEPVYPGVAVSANIQGTVILEAVVDQEGNVESLKVLRSVPVLDKPALDAVKQWRYSPVILNGRPEKFILTVAVTFRLEERKG
jgi:protein TonB